MNYYLPKQGVLSMHCSANYGPTGRRTTWRSSSASRAPARRPSRPIPTGTLIGDDEHGWSDDGVFNIEGGCYAKVIRLAAEGRAGDLRHHPRLRHRAGERGLDPETRRLDLDSDRR